MAKNMASRMCIVCRLKKPTDDLIRFQKFNNDIVFGQKQQGGKGSYICSSGDCVNKAVSKKLLNKVLRSPVNEETYNHLLKVKEGK